MIITKSNLLLGNTPTVSTGQNPTFDEASITDPDFSTFYTSLDNFRLTIDFGNTAEINYIAVAGINIEGAKDFSSRVSVLDGSTVISRTFISSNNCVVITFSSRSFSNLRVVLYNSIGSTPPKVRFISAGLSFIVPNGGEVAGYNRQFLNRSFKSKSTLSNIAAPINNLRKKMSAKGLLSLPNMTRDFSQIEWQSFLDFAVDNHFFIREQDPIPTISSGTIEETNNNSAYLCYELTNNKVKANAQTRSLNDISISFMVFNGL